MKWLNKPWMLLQPRLHLRLFVCAVVVPSPSAIESAGETPRPSGAEISALLMADAGRDIPPITLPSNHVERRNRRGRAIAFVVMRSSYRTGPSSVAAPAACDPTLEFGSFHPNTSTSAFLRRVQNTTPPHRSASPRISHPATALKVRLRCGLEIVQLHKRFHRTTC